MIDFLWSFYFSAVGTNFPLEGPSSKYFTNITKSEKYISYTYCTPGLHRKGLIKYGPSVRPSVRPSICLDVFSELAH